MVFVERNRLMAYYDLVQGAKDTTQLTFACSKSTVEALEKGVKYIQS